MPPYTPCTLNFMLTQSVWYVTKVIIAIIKSPRWKMITFQLGDLQSIRKCRCLYFMRCHFHTFTFHGQVEVEGIQHKTTEIWHKVYFPDDTEEVFQYFRIKSFIKKGGDLVSISYKKEQQQKLFCSIKNILFN